MQEVKGTGCEGCRCVRGVGAVEDARGVGGVTGAAGVYTTHWIQSSAIEIMSNIHSPTV